ncbi:hypothetical protein ACE41B_30610 [Bacillus cereus]|uniref:hypothetical protein n=1 Tax=Bacillus cereus TaxID=1396 RepID=UPI0035CA8C95
MTQRLDIFYRDECNEEAINTSIIADECRISVPRQIKLKIDFQFDSQTVDTPYVSIVDIDDDKVVYNKTLSRNRVDQAFLPASNKNKKYLFTIKNMFGYTYRFKCKENSRNAYEMRFDDNYRGEDYNDVIANLKFIPNPINDKGIVFLRHRKGTFINTAHGTGPSVQMIGEANYNPSISDEVWIIERPSGNGPVNYGDAVFIKTRKNYYLNSDGKVDSSVFVLPESNTVICHSDEIWFLE